MAATSQFIFFYPATDIYSQWYLSYLSIDGQTFNCAEQYMMYRKAQLFKDKTAMRQILASSSSKEQKAIGRRVKNFDQRRWDRYCREIVFIGTLAKFSQNKTLREELFKTAGSTLVEASPYDSIWGIGVGINDARIKDQNYWGHNWLGRIITIVRDQMITDPEYRLYSSTDRKTIVIPESIKNLD